MIVLLITWLHVMSVGAALSPPPLTASDTSSHAALDNAAS